MSHRFLSKRLNREARHEKRIMEHNQAFDWYESLEEIQKQYVLEAYTKMVRIVPVTWDDFIRKNYKVYLNETKKTGKHKAGMDALEKIGNVVIHKEEMEKEKREKNFAKKKLKI